MKKITIIVMACLICFSMFGITSYAENTKSIEILLTQASTPKEDKVFNFDGLKMELVDFETNKVYATSEFKTPNKDYYFALNVNVPKWEKGSKYKLRVKDFPIYYNQIMDTEENVTSSIKDENGTKVLEIPIVYSEFELMGDGENLKDIRGVTTDYEVYLLNPLNSVGVQIIDNSSKPLPNLEVEGIFGDNFETVKGVSDSKGQLTLTPKSTFGAKFTVKDAKNKSVIITKTEDIKLQNGITYVLLKVGNKEATQGNSEIDIMANNFENINLGLRNNKLGIQLELTGLNSFMLEKFGTTKFNKNGEHTVVIKDDNGFNIEMDKTELSAEGYDKVSLSITSKKVISVQSLKGEDKKVFAFTFINTGTSLDGKEFRGKGIVNFSAEEGKIYTIKDLDTNKTYDIEVSSTHRNSALNLNTGEITYNDKVTVDELVIPDTKDYTLLIVGVLCIALIGLGVMMIIKFKKKG